MLYITCKSLLIKYIVLTAWIIANPTASSIPVPEQKGCITWPWENVAISPNIWLRTSEASDDIPMAKHHLDQFSWNTKQFSLKLLFKKLKKFPVIVSLKKIMKLYWSDSDNSDLIIKFDLVQPKSFLWIVNNHHKINWRVIVTFKTYVKTISTNNVIIHSSYKLQMNHV